MIIGRQKEGSDSGEWILLDIGNSTLKGKGIEINPTLQEQIGKDGKQYQMNLQK